MLLLSGGCSVQAIQLIDINGKAQKRCIRITISRDESCHEKEGTIYERSE